MNAVLSPLEADVTVIVSLAALFLGIQAIRSFRLYEKLRGPLLATCPDGKRSAVVELAAGTMAMETLVGDVCFRVKQCSRWPMRRDCNQDCLREIKERFPELKSAGPWQVPGHRVVAMK